MSSPPTLRIGDVVIMRSSTDESRRHLLGRRGTVVAVQSGARATLSAVVFADGGQRWTMVQGVDELDVVEPYGEPVLFLGRGPL